MATSNHGQKQFFRKSFLAAILLLCVFAGPCAFAEIQSSQTYGYAIDLPEAFNETSKDTDGRGFFFRHTILPVTFVIKIYDNGTYENATSALNAVFSKLHASGEQSQFRWRNTDCVLASFLMSTPDTTNKQKGWAASVDLNEKKAQIILLCYTDENKESDYEQFILSVLDSLILDRAGFFEPGLVTAFAYPENTKQKVTLTIGGTTVETELAVNAAEAAKFVVNREYAVLTLYKNNKTWKEAWKRYYRMIFRDSYNRLKKPATDIFRVLFSSAATTDPEDPTAAIAQTLLTWVQNFTYARDPKNSDFTDLPSALTGTSCDCDSRALLLCVLMENMGVKSTLFISREYSHAIAGFDINKPGAKIEVNGKNYLLAETTAHVKLGLIAQDLSDTRKWIPVELP